jgi:hypothetical protein
MARVYPLSNRVLLLRVIATVVVVELVGLVLTRFALNWPWPFAIWIASTGAIGLVLVLYQRQRR